MQNQKELLLIAYTLKTANWIPPLGINLQSREPGGRLKALAHPEGVLFSVGNLSSYFTLRMRIPYG